MIYVLLKDPKIVAAWRLLETSVIVTLLGFFGSLQAAFTAPSGLNSYNWHTALDALALGIAAGIVNAIISYLNAVKNQNSAASITGQQAVNAIVKASGDSGNPPSAISVPQPKGQN